MPLCILPAILPKNVSWVFKSATRQWSPSFSRNQLMSFELIFPRKHIFLPTLYSAENKSTKGLLVSLQISEARKIPPRCLMSTMTPIYFPQFAQTTCMKKHYSPLVGCSNGNHTEHNSSSAFYNLQRWKTALSSSLYTSLFLQRMPRMYSNSRIHTQLTNLIKGPYTLSQS